LALVLNAYLPHPKKELDARYLSNWSGRNRVFCAPFVTKRRTRPARDKEITNSTSENGPNVLVAGFKTGFHIRHFKDYFLFEHGKKWQLFSQREAKNKAANFSFGPVKEKEKKVAKSVPNTSLVGNLVAKVEIDQQDVLLALKHRSCHSSWIPNLNSLKYITNDAEQDRNTSFEIYSKCKHFFCHQELHV